MPWFFQGAPVHRVEIARHACVIIFFVLSGYLISFTTIGRGRTWRQYVSARLARLYSVAIPALVLTALLWLVGSKIAPDHYAMFDRGHGFVRLALTTFFLNESWFFSAAPPTNMPFWSLSYEFWYYAIFGAAFFARGRFWRWALPLLCALICGPKVLLLFPVWLAGAAAFFLGKKYAPSRQQALIGLVALAAVVVPVASRIELPLERFGQPPLFYSALFVSDCVLGLMLATAIFFADRLLGEVRIPAALSHAVKAAAGVTFSIYLLHFPLLIFAAGVVRYDKTNPASGAAVGSAVLVTTIVLGAWFERRATLKKLGDWIERGFATPGL